MGPEAGSEAFPCFLPPSHGSQIAFLPPRLCYSIFPYKLPFAPMTSSQKPRLIPLLVFPLPPPHLVFIPCISSLCSLGFFGTGAHFFTFCNVFSLLLFSPSYPFVPLYYTCITLAIHLHYTCITQLHLPLISLAKGLVTQLS